jgi:hypothetical protein
MGLYVKIKKDRGLNFESAGDFHDVIEGEIGLSSLQLTDGVAVASHEFGELFLGHAMFFPDGPKPLPK